MSAPPTVLSVQHSIEQLRIRWGIFLAVTILFSILGFQLAQLLWPAPYAVRWVVLSLLADGYLLAGLWRNLAQNHRPGETAVLPMFGLGNTLSLARGLLMMALVGFLFQPRPGGGALDDWRAWIPGLLYTLAALPDYVDGYLARRTNHVTPLGEWLDMTLDSVGVFTATFLAVQYGTVPGWYLPIGLARYLFLAGIWVRQKRRLPVYEMPYSVRRRGFAALKMGFIFVILLPPFAPPATHLGAAVFGIPFALAFIWDWLIVSGALQPDVGNRHPRLKHFTLHWLPWLPRALAVWFILPSIRTHLQNPDLQWLGFLEGGVTLFLALGVWPRTMAIVAVCLVGANQVFAPLTIDQFALIVTYISMIFLGSGTLSLWPFEERLIYHRPGD